MASVGKTSNRFVDSFVKYVNEAKPYRSKLGIRGGQGGIVERYLFTDTVSLSAADNDSNKSMHLGADLRPDGVRTDQGWLRNYVSDGARRTWRIGTVSNPKFASQESSDDFASLAESIRYSGSTQVSVISQGARLRAGVETEDRWSSDWRFKEGVIPGLGAPVGGQLADGDWSDWIAGTWATGESESSHSRAFDGRTWTGPGITTVLKNDVYQAEGVDYWLSRGVFSFDLSTGAYGRLWRPRNLASTAEEDAGSADLLYEAVRTTTASFVNPSDDSQPLAVVSPDSDAFRIVCTFGVGSVGFDDAYGINNPSGTDYSTVDVYRWDNVSADWEYVESVQFDDSTVTASVTFKYTYASAGDPLLPGSFLYEEDQTANEGDVWYIFPENKITADINAPDETWSLIKIAPTALVSAPSFSNPGAHTDTPALTVYPVSLEETEETIWTLIFNGDGTYELFAEDSITSIPLSGYPKTISLVDGCSYKDEFIAFTIVPPADGWIAGESFTWSTTAPDTRTHYKVFGSVSGWQDDAMVGQWYWNGKIGFYIPELSYYFNSNIYYVRDFIDNVHIITNGSGYTDGIYEDVAVQGGTGSGMVATVEIVDGIIVRFTITDPGTGYVISDSLSVLAAEVGGTGSGFTAEVVADSTNEGIYSNNPDEDSSPIYYSDRYATVTLNGSRVLPVINFVGSPSVMATPRTYVLKFIEASDDSEPGVCSVYSSAEGYITTYIPGTTYEDDYVSFEIPHTSGSDYYHYSAGSLISFSIAELASRTVLSGYDVRPYDSIPYDTVFDEDTYPDNQNSSKFPLYYGHGLVIFQNTTNSDVFKIDKTSEDRIMFKITDADNDHPELLSTDDWIPLEFSYHDRIDMYGPMSTAFHSDLATYIEARAIGTGELVFSVKSPRHLKSNYVQFSALTFDPTFFSTYLPLGTEYTIRIQAGKTSGNKARVSVNEQYEVEVNGNVTFSSVTPEAEVVYGG